MSMDLSALAGEDSKRKALLRKIEALPPEQQEKFREMFARQAAAKPFYCTRGRTCDGNPHEGFPYQHARSDQWAPEGRPGHDWRHWISMSGRGGGKTQTGSAYSLELSKRMRRLGIIAPTAADLRTTIAEGPSGLIRTCERAGKPGVYEPSKRKFTFASGAEVLLFSAEEPDRLRGSQVEFWWGDEPAHWAQVEEVWEQMNFTLRLGTEPHVLLTTTPLATKWMKEMVADPRSRVVRVSTFANAANLAKDFIEQMKIQYEGTRMGRQELHGEILEDVEGALWSGDMFQRCEMPEEFDKIVVGVDPAGSANKRSDQTGIIVVGKIAKHSYVLEDLSGTYTPDQWARKVKYAYDKWDANAVVAERNYGGDLVKSNLKSLDPFMYVKEVRATRGKVVRAEPVVGRYEQGRVFHVAGANLAKLEEEQVSWVPSDSRSPSPNRVDALVWAETDLQGVGGAARAFSPVGRSIR